MKDHKNTDKNDSETPAGSDDWTIVDANSPEPTRFGDGAPDADGEAKPTPPSDALLQAQEEVAKFKNEYLYLRAEFENYKKQAIKERSDMRKYAAERLVCDLLEVLDILETALATPVTNENRQDFVKGIELTAAELKNALVRHGVTEIPAHGQPFDPSVHEALTSEESDLPPGSVARVFKKPYKLHERVVRPGKVVVAKPKS